METEEQGFVQQLVTLPAVEALAEAVLRRLTRGDVVPIDAVLGTPGEDGIRGEFGPMIRYDHAGLAARWSRVLSSRATRLPEIEVSGTAARHSRVTSSTTFRMRKRRPQVN